MILFLIFYFYVASKVFQKTVYRKFYSASDGDSIKFEGIFDGSYVESYVL